MQDSGEKNKGNLQQQATKKRLGAANPGVLFSSIILLFATLLFQQCTPAKFSMNGMENAGKAGDDDGAGADCSDGICDDGPIGGPKNTNDDDDGDPNPPIVDCPPRLPENSCSLNDVDEDDDELSLQGRRCAVLCHVPPGNPENAHTIYVGLKAVSAHMRNHGDTEGLCPQ